MGWVVNANPQPLYPRERPGTHCVGGWVGPRAGLDRCEESRPPPTGIRSPDRIFRSESLYRLEYRYRFKFFIGLVSWDSKVVPTVNDSLLRYISQRVWVTAGVCFLPTQTITLACWPTGLMTLTIHLKSSSSSFFFFFLPVNDLA